MLQVNAESENISICSICGLLISTESKPVLETP